VGVRGCHLNLLLQAAFNQACNCRY
jgi:hypothetical protein